MAINSQFYARLTERGFSAADPVVSRYAQAQNPDLREAILVAVGDYCALWRNHLTGEYFFASVDYDTNDA